MQDGSLLFIESEQEHERGHAAVVEIGIEKEQKQGLGEFHEWANWSVDRYEQAN